MPEDVGQEDLGHEPQDTQQPQRIPYRPQLPTAQQVTAALAILSLMGPMALGGMPVIPVTIEDERRRQQDEIQQVSESSVGLYQSSTEAEIGLAASQLRLAQVTREVEDLTTHDVTERDVIHAANRVLTGNVEEKLSGKFRSALKHVTWDTVDLFILRDNEEYAAANS
ncbi:MAG: hypothetical protein IKG21_01865 [Atopobiaceae bacterium]|nr:hypothetical protein [Atopobiaceae bacterium]